MNTGETDGVLRVLRRQDPRGRRKVAQRPPVATGSTPSRPKTRPSFTSGTTATFTTATTRRRSPQAPPGDRTRPRRPVPCVRDPPRRKPTEGHALKHAETPSDLRLRRSERVRLARGGGRPTATPNTAAPVTPGLNSPSRAGDGHPARLPPAPGLRWLCQGVDQAKPVQPAGQSLTCVSMNFALVRWAEPHAATDFWYHCFHGP